MPIFLKPERTSPRHSAAARCPKCGQEVTGEVEATPRRAALASLKLLQEKCNCHAPLKFLLDSTPAGFSLYFSGLGGPRQLAVHGSAIFGPYGELTPGGLPLLLVTDAPPPKKSKKQSEHWRRESWLKGVQRLADRFRRKGFFVQVCYVSPDNPAGDVLPPLPAVKRKARA